MQRHRIPLVGVLCLIALYVSAQTILSPQVVFEIEQVPQQPRKKQNDTISKPGGKVIEIINADSSVRISTNDLQVFILMRNVVLLHEGAYLYCDSARYYTRENAFEAFNNVRMEQGDTLFLYGKYMDYDGNTKMVKVRENVSLEHSPLSRKNPITLFTDSLNYDRMMNIGYYFDGGMLVDSLNELTSFWGQYEPDMKMATFKDSVILTNPNFTLYSNRLKYDTDRRIAHFSTETKIVSDSGTIYTTNGWYNTATEESVLLDQSTIVNKEGDRLLRGDSIFYFKTKGYGEVFGNMFLQDTTKHVILKGNYGYYDETNNYAMATDSAICIEYSQKDTMYIHADTLKLITIIDSTNLKRSKSVEAPELAQRSAMLHSISSQADSLERGTMVNDSIENVLPEGYDVSIEHDSLRLTQLGDVDSLLVTPARISVSTSLQKQDTVPITYRQIKAYYGVRFYRSDMQGVCDSLQFSSKDSIIHMFKEPVLWNTNRQLSGDTIDIFMNDSTIDYMHVKRYAFSIEDKDSIHFNQLKSRSLKVFFDATKKVRQVLAEGNVETISYPEERDGELNGILNWLESSYLRINMHEGRFQRLVVWPKPVGKTTPFSLVKPEQLRLKDFFWYDYLRPLDKDDVFRKVSKKKTDTRPKRSSIFDREE